MKSIWMVEGCCHMQYFGELYPLSFCSYVIYNIALLFSRLIKISLSFTYWVECVTRSCLSCTMTIGSFLVHEHVLVAHSFHVWTFHPWIIWHKNAFQTKWLIYMFSYCITLYTYLVHFTSMWGRFIDCR